jgi:hypothetical protein
LLYAVHVRQLAGGSPVSRPNLMEVKGSEAQGRREVGSEGSVEQRYGPMDKNRIAGLRRRTSEQLIAKSVSIKDAGAKSGGSVSKAIELITGDLLHVSDS